MDRLSENRLKIISARIRYSPSSQPLRENAIDQIVLQNMLLESGWLSADEMLELGYFTLPDGTNILAISDLRTSLDRLQKADVLEHTNESGIDKYKLTPSQHKEVLFQVEEADRKLTSVVKKLWNNNTDINLDTFRSIFLDAVCHILLKLGDFQVGQIQGGLNVSPNLSGQTIDEALQRSIPTNDPATEKVFRDALTAFFGAYDPDSQFLKWNLMQNVYISKMIGIDPGGYYLTKDVLEGGHFYLDTNVAINALEPKAKHHHSFNVFSDACKALGIELKILQISLNELTDYIESQKRLFEETKKQIPNDTYRRIKGIAAQIYSEMKDDYQAGTVTIDEVFLNYSSPADDLKDEFNVDRVDDHWFDDAVNQAGANDLVKKIKVDYEHKRRKPKHPSSAQHDALLLLWIDKERERRNTNKVQTVTLDTTLPGVSAPILTNTNDRTLAITLDAILQWIAPISGIEDVDLKFSKIFSDAIRFHLLPSMTLFELGDFSIFNSLNMQCANMPSEDVEGCITTIKQNIPDLDLRNPNGALHPIVWTT